MCTLIYDISCIPFLYIVAMHIRTYLISYLSVLIFLLPIGMHLCNPPGINIMILVRIKRPVLICHNVFSAQGAGDGEDVFLPHTIAASHNDCFCSNGLLFFFFFKPPFLKGADLNRSPPEGGENSNEDPERGFQKQLLRTNHRQHSFVFLYRKINKTTNN